MRAKRGKLTTSLMLLSAVPLLTFGLIVMLITSKIIYSSLREEVRYSLGVLGTFSYRTFEVLYPGDFEKSGTVLLKGGRSLEGRDELVDDLKETAGVDATLFYGKERYLTTIVGSDGARAVGTAVEKAVTDKVLKMVAHAISVHMEHIGFAFRWGGEEFLMVYEELDRKRTFACVEKLRAVINGSELDWHGEKIRITMTFGIADCGEAGDVKELIRLADARLYSGKSSGRNQTVVCGGQDGK